jgi:FkbM family methyltransferase
VFPKAVTAEGGTIRLFVHPTNVGGHSIYQSRAGGKHVEIESVTLSEVMETQKIERCDLLKLDCEGAEKEILMSLDPVLCPRIPRIIFEPTPTVYAVDEVKQHLVSLGYRISAGRRGLVVATRDS